MKRYKKMFGIDEWGFPILPVKFSNVKMSRIKQEALTKVCGRCFPHGIDTLNSKYVNQQRCWKKYRKNQYKVKRISKEYL